MIISSSFLVAIAVAQPTGPFAPRSWWRFEDAAHLGADEMGRHDLTPASTMDPETVASPSQRTTGGVVGGYIDFSGGDQNLSWTANASYLPMQCSHKPAAGGLCPKDDPMLCANGHCPRGLTIELLVRLGRDALATACTQLDGWHEDAHPSWWSAHFQLEAELHDEAIFGGAWQHPHTRTEGIVTTEGAGDGRVGSPRVHHDLTSALGFIRLQPHASAVSYSFEPRAVDPLTAVTATAPRGYTVRLRLRGAGSAACVRVSLAAAAGGPDEPVGVACAGGGATWLTCVLGRDGVPASVEAPAGSRRTVRLSAAGGAEGVEVDFLRLERRDQEVPGRAGMPVCAAQL